MNDMKFSVSMCVYGGDNPEWFDAAVASVLGQTVVPAEIVIVVDGPVPKELGNVIKKYSENKLFKIVYLEVNRGHGEARRIGLENCSYELVALMDADDISVPDRFEKQLELFAKDKLLDIAGGTVNEFIGTPDNAIATRMVKCTDEEIKNDMKIRSPLNQPTVMFKKDSVNKAGGYIDWYCNEDYYLWIRMALMGMKFANTSQVLLNFRVDEKTYQRRGGIKYFRSEYGIQKLLLKNKMIGFGLFVINVTKRLVVQVLLPNRLRGWVFKKFARRNPK